MGDVCGACVPQIEYQQADIWVSPEACRRNAETPLSTLFHEILHVAFAAAGDRSSGGRNEHLINRLAGVMVEAYEA